MYSLTGFGIPARNPQFEAIQSAAAYDAAFGVYEVPPVGLVLFAFHAVPGTGLVFDRTQLVANGSDLGRVAFLGWWFIGSLFSGAHPVPPPVIEHQKS
ncbi:hypothetical protein [Nocardia terpenica]|uniref:Uncharacterized protein n=1 Tax=Nocardia terpenica TaxID=455432 RepID=A0A6G9Z713_9NOCA|nr:hypothetical protein [Nocardia terpenica]QIS21240.1 hypothetical protein F6W96_25865 [Nocardia terpenica]